MFVENLSLSFSTMADIPPEVFDLREFLLTSSPRRGWRGESQAADRVSDDSKLEEIFSNT
ncbi:MAG: hypothetical protein QW356_07635 [Candidatus Hadarchaeales archaeon]